MGLSGTQPSKNLLNIRMKKPHQPMKGWCGFALTTQSDKVPQSL